MTSSCDNDPASFQPTRWSLVRQAQGDSPTSTEALSTLCECYWQPVYRFLCCQGHSQEEARETTQAFFAKLLETGAIDGAHPDRGRFRSYVLGAVKHFLSDERKAARREKRGGGQLAEPLETDRSSAPGLQVADPRAVWDDALFDREWAFAVLHHALTSLEAEFQKKDRAGEFALLRAWLPGAGSKTPDPAEARAALNLTDSAFKVAVHRLRRRFRDAVRKEIGRTVDGEAAIASELRYLLEVVSR